MFTIKEMESFLGTGISLLANEEVRHIFGCSSAESVNNNCSSSECPSDCDCEDRCDGCIGDFDSCGEGGCPIG